MKHLYTALTILALTATAQFPLLSMKQKKSDLLENFEKKYNPQSYKFSYSLGGISNTNIVKIIWEQYNTALKTYSHSDTSFLETFIASHLLDALAETKYKKCYQSVLVQVYKDMYLDFCCKTANVTFLNDLINRLYQLKDIDVAHHSIIGELVVKILSLETIKIDNKLQKKIDQLYLYSKRNTGWFWAPHDWTLHAQIKEFVSDEIKNKGFLKSLCQCELF